MGGTDSQFAPPALPAPAGAPGASSAGLSGLTGAGLSMLQPQGGAGGASPVAGLMAANPYGAVAGAAASALTGMAEAAKSGATSTSTQGDYHGGDVDMTGILGGSVIGQSTFGNNVDASITFGGRTGGQSATVAPSASASAGLPSWVLWIAAAVAVAGVLFLKRQH